MPSNEAKFKIPEKCIHFGEHEQEIYMTGEVIEPNLNIPESEINYGGVSILMKASKQFHSDNKIPYFFTN
ncbi:unnamed protein product [Rotaria sp. Silwood1]|nr:unnamed protein product [Rotaria sp. Silwood1]